MLKSKGLEQEEQMKTFLKMSRKHPGGTELFGAACAEPANDTQTPCPLSAGATRPCSWLETGLQMARLPAPSSQLSNRLQVHTAQQT